MSGSTYCYRSMCILSLSLLTGCIFTSSPSGAGSGDGNDMSTSPVTDMPSVEVDMPTDQDVFEPDADITSPDMTEPPSCETLTCLEGVCVDGECIDLLSDNNHCGAPGRACASGDTCEEGVCVCGAESEASNMHHIKVFTEDDNIKPWPHPQVVMFPSFSLFRCSNEDTPVNDCFHQDLEFNEDVSPEVPQYLAMGVENGAPGGSDSLSLVGVSPVDGPVSYLDATIPADSRKEGEHKILSYRVVATGINTLQVFVLWEGADRTNRIYAYNVTNSADRSLSVIRDTSYSSDGYLLKSNGVLDFDLAYGSFDSVGALVIAATQLTGISADERHTLRLSGFVSVNDTWMRFDGDTEYGLNDSRQAHEGMGMVLSSVGDQHVLHISLLEDSAVQGFSTPPNRALGTTRSYYNYHAFQWDATRRKFNSVPLFSETISYTDIPQSQGEWRLALYGDRSDVPSPVELSVDGDGINSWGWFRHTSANDGEVTRFQLWTRPWSGSAAEVPLVGLEDVASYDGEVFFDKSGNLYSLSMERLVDDEPAQLVIRSLNLPMSESEVPYFSAANVLSPFGNYKRFTLAIGPHATGILATTNDSNAQADLYFAVGDRAVCKPRSAE